MRFPSELPLGTGYLTMSFRGTLNDQMAGFYRSGYYDLFGRKQHMGVTQLEAIDARRMFPCVDEPAAKAEFEVKVTAPAHFSVISNMPESFRTLRVDNEEPKSLLQDITFMTTPRMSTYLLALCVGEFEWVQATTKRGTLVRVLATPGKANQCHFALDVGVRSLEWYEDFFAINYPLPKLDMIAVPDFAAGAMENWGLVTYREIDLLCDASTVSISRKTRLASTITHELAHQWFGNLVTMEWWDDLWLNEGFASFMQTLSADALFPEWKIWDQYVEEDLDAARGLDGLRSSHPVQVPIPKAEDVEEVFDAISYCKGSCIVRLLYHVMGPDAFKTGIRAYMQKHAYGNTVTDDLWEALQSAVSPAGLSDLNITQLMESWTRQTGYPVIQVDRAGDRSIRVRQEYFVSDGSRMEGDEKYSWIVPLFIEKSDGSKSMHILREKESVIPLGDFNVVEGWVKVNSGEIAPIRVQYTDKELLGRLLSNGMPKLDVVDRVGILSDIRALGKSGRANMNDIITVLKAYATPSELNADVWEAIETTLNSIDAVVVELGKGDEFDAFVCNLVVPKISHVGWNNRPNDSEVDRRLRACLFRLVSTFGHSSSLAADIRTEAIRRFTEYQSNPKTESLSDDTRTSVFKLALSSVENADGGKLFWNHLISVASDPSTDQTTCLDIYAASGYVRDIECKKSTLDWALSEQVKIQDFMYPIGSVRKSGRVGADLAWDWIGINLSRCQDRVAKANPALLASVVISASGGSVSGIRASEIETRFNNLTSIKRNIAQLVEGIRSNAEFVKRTCRSDILLYSPLYCVV